MFKLLFLDIKNGLVKNQELDKPIITPTTRFEDKPISKQQI